MEKLARRNQCRNFNQNRDYVAGNKMIFTVRSSPGQPLTVGLADVVRAFATAEADLRWVLLQFDGTTSPTMPLWKGMAALELMSAAQQGLSPMGTSDLMVIGNATTDIYDVLLVGSRTLDSIPKDLPKDPIQCFRTLALRYDAVVECV
ncbi:MAG TPA: hypothetical protein VJ276_24275, partial [Thermoanaerobaculia bacterium]|nr:hypothetical protein [Thermoanaerobaculia bacterium]